MSVEAVLTLVVTFVLVGWISYHRYTNARRFAENPLAGPRMRVVSRLYVPILEVGLSLCLVGIAITSRSRGLSPEESLAGGVPFVLLLLAVLVAPGAGTLVAVQGFTLSERLKRRGDVDAAGRLASKGFGILILGAASVLVIIFAAGILAGA